MNTFEESSIEFTTGQGVEPEARLVRLGRFDVVFEVFSPENVLRPSEVPAKPKIVNGGRVFHHGRATVASLLSGCGGGTCEVASEDPGNPLPIFPACGGLNVISEWRRTTVRRDHVFVALIEDETGPVAASVDDGDLGRSFAECLDAKMRVEVVKKGAQFKQGLHRNDVPVDSGALTRPYLNRNPDAVKSGALIDFKSRWQEFSGPGAQGCRQWRRSPWAERTGAIHG